MFSLFIQHEFSKPLAIGSYINVNGVKLNPYHTPTETHDFNYLPFCLDKTPKKMIELKGKVTPINIYFLTPIRNSSLCTLKIDSQNYQKLSNAIHRQFIYKLYVTTKFTSPNEGTCCSSATWF